jgi:GntR family transcriptional regulator
LNRYFLKLEQLARSGKLKPGERLASVSEMAREMGATEGEIKEAISELIYEGVLERERPAQPGQTVRIPQHRLWGTLGGSHSITKEAHKRGEEPGVEITSWKLVEAWPTVASKLQLEAGEQVQIMERMRSANGIPVAIEVSYFPAKYYPGITPELFTETGSGQSSFAVMEKKFGLKSEKARDELTVVCLEEREANLLHVAPGTPVLQRFRVTFSDKGIPIKASRAVWLFRAGYEMSV